MLGDSRRGSEGFCSVRAALGGRKNRSERGAGGSKNCPPAERRPTVVTEAETRATNLP